MEALAVNMPTQQPTLFAKMLIVMQAVRGSVLKARAQGLSYRQILNMAMGALQDGPRVFARKAMHFSGEGPLAAGSPAVHAPDSYVEWLGGEDIRTDPAASRGKVSVIMPVCDTPLSFLREAVESLEAQNYSDWELCIHDDASTKSEIGRFLATLARSTSRVKVSLGTHRRGISDATNAALAMADGKWVAFLDHDDLLHPNALEDCVTALVGADAQLVYTDHDMLSAQGARQMPYLKPDWSLDLFLSQMYLGHLVVMERTLVQELGGLRSEMDGAQDYDLVLRAVSRGARIVHVPKVRYHWRMHAGSTSANADSKPYAHVAGQRALQSFVDQRYPGAEARDGAHIFCYDIRYPLPSKRGLPPSASIIIPTRDGLDVLETCVQTLLSKTQGIDYEVLVVDNGSCRPETLEWLQSIQRDDRVRVLPAEVPFNWSALNNIAVREAKGDVLAFMNNDTEVLDSDWLVRLAENACRADVGVCGPLLLYPDGSIQHAGVVVGMGGWADHVFKGQRPVHNQQLFASPVLRRNVLAVTGACMVVERAKFDALGGFDESFIVCGSDVELCLRAHASGLRNVYVPEARLVHHESKTRDPRAIPESDFVRSAEAYGDYRVYGDPYYNVNLDPMSAQPALRARQ